MEFFKKNFGGKSFSLVPVGDFHFGSPQCDIDFVKRVISQINDDPTTYWCGMGDLIENAIIGSLGDTYTQTMPPKDQLDYICDLLEPIKDRGLFLIAGNHEQRTARLVGMSPEAYISVKLGVPFLGFSCMAVFGLPECKTPFTWECYFHHSTGGGYTSGGKVNRADSLRRIVPTADAIFSGHSHITSRIPYTWYEAGDKTVLRKTGYNYIIGSALTWGGSYAEEKAKPSASVEHIKVRFRGSTNGRNPDGRVQEYYVIS